MSDEAVLRYAEIKGIKVYPEKESLLTVFWLDPPELRTKRSYNTLYADDIERDDPVLVQVVEELGDKANGRCAKLAIENVASGTEYLIDEYDGMESIQTRDGTNWRVAR